MNTPTTKKKVKQSNYMTFGHYKTTSIYSGRILAYLVNLAQPEINKHKNEDDYIPLEQFDYDCLPKEITIKISDIEPGRRAQRVRDALKELHETHIECGGFGDNWIMFNPIPTTVLNPGKGVIQFSINPIFWKWLLNFTHGYSQFNYAALFQLKTVYALRFFTWFSCPSEPFAPIKKSIEELKKIFGLEDKYKDQIHLFTKRVIETAIKDLNETKECPFSFSYTAIKNGRKTIGFVFTPIKKEPETTEERTKYLSSQMYVQDCTPEQRNYFVNLLMGRCGFQIKFLLTPQMRFLSDLYFTYFGLTDLEKTIERITAHKSDIKLDENGLPLCDLRGKPLKKFASESDFRGYVISSLRNEINDYEMKINYPPSVFPKNKKEAEKYYHDREKQKTKDLL